MSWRKVLGVEDSADNPYTHNTHNTHNSGKSYAQGNSAYIADSAYRDEIEKSRDDLIANQKVMNDKVQSELIKKGGSIDALKTTPTTQNLDNPAIGATTGKSELVVKLSVYEEGRVKAWLAYIEETDLAIIHEILEMCRADLKHRQYYLKRSAEVPK